ncbi:MAG: hypothetical protein HQ582_18775 [Planctomycetes bacterium]|nr:hypothetical protein [Planctomycetota bacterium]
MRNRTTRVILAYVAAAMVVPAVALRADCPSLKQLATWEYEEKVESESIERNADIAELKVEIESLEDQLKAVETAEATGEIRADQAQRIRDDVEATRANLQPKLDKEQMEFRHWRESEALSHRRRLEKIDLEAAVSDSAGLCLSMDELLRRCDVRARWRREAEEIRHRQTVDRARLLQATLNFRLPDIGFDDRTIQLENQIHADKAAMIELTCNQQKEIIRARHGQCPYSEMKLQYMHERQIMQQQHRSKMQLARLQHESGLRILKAKPWKGAKDIEFEELRYRHAVALETLQHEHDLARFEPDLRWKVSTGRLDAGTIWMLKKTNAQWRREEETLRHGQALKELEVSHGADLPDPLGGPVDTKSLADSRLNLAQKKENLRYERAKQEENALHRRTLRSIEAICPPRVSASISASSDCGCNH